MKNVLIALLILAASAAFANTPNDSDVTLSNWAPIDESIVTDLEGDNGFTALSGNNAGATFYTSDISGWLFDPNETIRVTVFEDFVTPELIADREADNSYFAFAVGNSETMSFALYEAEYNGPGDYVLTVAEIDGLAENNEISLAQVMIGSHIPDDNNIHIFAMPVNSTLTVRFNSAEQEIVVPEPMAAAYALVGFAPLFGLKKRIKK